MAARTRIVLRQVRSLKLGQTKWDKSLPGFGARRQQSDAVAYVLKYRTAEGRQRWFTIGQHGAPWTPDTARAEAKRLLGDVAHKADPAAEKRAKRNAKTVGELCDLYLSDAEAGRFMTRRRTPKKATTLATDRGRIERHIKPLLGRRTVAAVTREDIEAFMYDVTVGKTAGKTKTTKKRGLANVRGGKGTASRTVGLLGAIFSYAVRHRMRADNPVHGVTRPADGRRERRVSDGEYKALGNALRQADAARVWPAAVAAIRFLALTGWRRGEALGLRWDEIDIARRTATRKRLQLILDIVPTLSKVGVLRNPQTPLTGLSLIEIKVAAERAKTEILVFDATTPDQVNSQFAAAAAAGAKAIIVLEDPLIFSVQKQFAELGSVPR